MKTNAGDRARSLLAAGLCCVAATACHRVPDAAPPRATDRVSVPPHASTIAVPVDADLDRLAIALDRAVPRELWAIDKPDQVCAPSRKVKVLFARIKTPTIRCRIVGRVTRGAMTIGGAGRDIVVTLPLHATISARDVGGVLKQETAEADARVRAVIRLDLAPDWSPRGTVDIAYDWTDAPHVDLLGQRIEFADKADEKLKRIVADLERTLPQELAKLRFREQVTKAWRAAHTSLSLDGGDPAVWMRITPRELSYGGYTIERHRLTLHLGLKALTETFVGPRPADPAPTPLPPLKRVPRTTGAIVFAIPVIADYSALEPVLKRALDKRAARPFAVPGIGPVTARFGKVTAYGTTGGRIAVGLTFSAAAPGDDPAHGTVWLTARPVNVPGSREVAFTGLDVAGTTDSTGSSLLIRLADAPGLSATIAASLTQNFSRDYDRLLARVAHEIAEERQGDLLIRARIDDVRTGRIVAAGQGLYLPVAGRGTASITLRR